MTPDDRETCPKCGLRIKHRVKGDIGYLTRFTCNSVQEQDSRFVQSAICCLVEERLTVAEQQLAVAQGTLEEIIPLLHHEKEEAVANQDFVLAARLVSILAIINRETK